jgi:hypothetical protein
MSFNSEDTILYAEALNKIKELEQKLKEAEAFKKHAKQLIQNKQDWIDKLLIQVTEADELLKKLNAKQVIKYKEINDYFEKYKVSE